MFTYLSSCVFILCGVSLEARNWEMLEICIQVVKSFEIPSAPSDGNFPISIQFVLFKFAL
jgi:hypothetical protein